MAFPGGQRRFRPGHKCAGTLRREAEVRRWLQPCRPLLSRGETASASASVFHRRGPPTRSPSRPSIRHPPVHPAGRRVPASRQFPGVLALGGRSAGSPSAPAAAASASSSARPSAASTSPQCRSLDSTGSPGGCRRSQRASPWSAPGARSGTCSPSPASPRPRPRPLGSAAPVFPPGRAGNRRPPAITWATGASPPAPGPRPEAGRPPDGRAPTMRNRPVLDRRHQGGQHLLRTDQAQPPGPPALPAGVRPASRGQQDEASGGRGEDVPRDAGSERWWPGRWRRVRPRPPPGPPWQAPMTGAGWATLNGANVSPNAPGRRQRRLQRSQIDAPEGRRLGRAGVATRRGGPGYRRRRWHP